MSESIVIANSTIRQQDGLYCLNDLHRASGGRDLCRQTMCIDDFRLRTICHQKTDGVFFSLEQIKLLQNRGVWDFLGVNSDYLFFFEKFNGEAEYETF